MSVLNENQLMGASAAGEYEIEQSLRFDDGRGTYLSRTFPSAGNRKVWTWSCWVKRGNLSLGSQSTIFHSYGSGNQRTELTFETNTGYDNGSALTTYVSSNFTGDVTTATWLKIDAALSSGPSGGYNSFSSSGSINISCLSSKVHVAFRYEGSDGGITTTFQIDNVKVTGN